MTAYQRLLYLTVWVVVVVPFDFFPLGSLQAQEEDPVDAEWYRELGEDLEVAEQRLEMLGQEVKYAEDRIHVLRQIRVLLLRLGKLEKSLEAAEEAEDEALIERHETQLEMAELELGKNEIQLEWLERYHQILELKREIPLSLDSARERLQQCLEQMEEARGLIDVRHRALLQGDEDKVGEIEERFEEFSAELEEATERSELELQLYWAREEGDEEEAESLEEELRALENRQEQVRRFEQGQPLERNPDALPIQLVDADFEAIKDVEFSEAIRGQLNRFCVDCHDDSTASGELDLTMLMDQQPLVIQRTKWLNIVEQLKTRSMPPEDGDQPTEMERRHLAAWLTRAIRDFDYETVRRVGYEPVRRLTREEYNNTIRDLIGVDLRPADRFPTDLSASSGFRNSANSLFFQPITLERFVGAADFVVEQGFPLGPSDSKIQTGWNGLLVQGESLENPEQLIKRFAARAYRRPLNASEVKTLVDLYQLRIGQGDSIQQALRTVVRSILISPMFLFRNEAVSEDHRLSEYELASRLSFFLWASMPDDILFDLAARGQLSDPVQIKKQVERMLEDPRSETLGTLFAAQWLGTDNLDRMRPDQIDNPWATDTLVDSMKAETAKFFHFLVREDLPLERLLDADFSFVNAELANHYGLDGVRGETLQRVSMNTTPRRGVLGHASILAITSFPGRASPVLRGNWILTELLGTPPPPPPPNVSEFDER
ncbi:MAG: DUF1592 domain-containing protein, partial [Planctomycetota bacterium]|nr:DUF1592 domain-containing protein [Planctomycetota bacterium]